MDIYLIWLGFVLTAICEGVPCEVIPKDPYVEHGSSIKVMFKKTCNTWKLNSHSKNFWTLENKRIDESLYESNSTFSILTISNITLPKVTVRFHSYVQEYEQIMSGTIIRTYQRPRNISCVTFMSPCDFVCHWKHDIQPTEKINYKVIRQSQEGPRETCSSNHTSCSFKSCPIFSYQNYITVQAESTFWKINSYTLELDPWNTVKIDPPKHVRVVALRACLKVDWERPGGQMFLSQVIHCQVRYAQHVMYMSMGEMVETATMTTAEVEECTNHTTSVRCSLDKALWSNWSRPVTVLSDLNVRGWQLNLWRKIDPPDNRGTRGVHLMWKGISPACNAIDGYKLTWREAEMVVSSSVDRASITVDQWACRVTLAAFRGNTTFPEDSVYLPAIGESLYQVTAPQTTAKDGVIYVSWAVPPARPVNGYMIDWTADGETYNWLRIQDTDLKLTGLLNFTPYTITVTPLYDTNTGLGTVLTICSKEKAPDYIWTINVSDHEKSAQVIWTTVPQSPCTGAIVNYTVFYKTRTQPEMSVTVNSGIQKVTLVSLQSDTEYSVHVMASAVTGKTNSSVSHFKTKRYGRTFVITTGFICGVSFLVVLVTGLYCVIQWKRILRKMVPNPGLSSLAFWSSQEYQTPYNNPLETETICENIYPCEVDTKTDNASGPTHPEDEDTLDGEETGSRQMDRRSSGFGSSSSCDSQSVEESIRLIPAPAELPSRSQPDKGLNPVESVSSQDSPLDSLDSQLPERCPINPYRGQTPVESPVPPAGHEEELGRSLLETRYHSHTDSSPAYVTLGMLQHRKSNGET
ncbi:interleukin-6 receptor subunit beta-like isoform X2 [Esox lucius]|uniref:Fibronectin type-III domain-containing protein n=1 Tax=Esox lucius TaxID=8010 RepID=A0A3P8YNA3_ESOLU|nr:interleukin-6 receptor subunit beta-like isoform X2 [Esox lucius]